MLSFQPIPGLMYVMTLGLRVLKLLRNICET